MNSGLRIVRIVYRPLLIQLDVGGEMMPRIEHSAEHWFNGRPEDARI